MEKRAVQAGAVLAALGAALQLAARSIAGFGEWYGGNVYPLLVGTLGRLSGLFPFSVSEMGLYVLAIAFLVFAVKNRKKWLRIPAVLFLAASVLFFLYTVCCGINYYRTPFSVKAGFEVRESSLDELKELCACLAEQVARADGARSEDWYGDVPGKAAAAMEKLGETYPELDGFYPRPKALAVSEILSVQQLSGIYSPFTVEANYNGDMTPYNIPHTACHELSHLRGFMREDEANFIGYLACIGSGDADFIYSGYLLGFIYAGNALAARDYRAYADLYYELPEAVQEDLLQNYIFWEAWDGAVAEAANRMNDTYLKINDQKDGVESYGRVVDLMLSHFRAQKSCNIGSQMLK